MAMKGFLEPLVGDMISDDLFDSIDDLLDFPNDEDDGLAMVESWGNGAPLAPAPAQPMIPAGCGGGVTVGSAPRGIDGRSIAVSGDVISSEADALCLYDEIDTANLEWLSNFFEDSDINVEIIAAASPDPKPRSSSPVSVLHLAAGAGTSAVTSSSSPCSSSSSSSSSSGHPTMSPPPHPAAIPVPARAAPNAPASRPSPPSHSSPLHPASPPPAPPPAKNQRRTANRRRHPPGGAPTATCRKRRNGGPGRWGPKRSATPAASGTNPAACSRNTARRSAPRFCRPFTPIPTGRWWRCGSGAPRRRRRRAAEGRFRRVPWRRRIVTSSSTSGGGIEKFEILGQNCFFFHPIFIVFSIIPIRNSYHWR
ncbi:hypothetical protein KSP40_PGU009970 [Platanthera guangdongensis]|uniref:Uncharacterized protein n=1 Tax=Platanthera guangdongensis TaxID=2320717 RepID=A0ABR2M9B9_9ASPA